MRTIRLAIMFAAALAPALSSAAPPAPAVDRARVPLSFEPNRGQTSPEVRFLSRGAGYMLLLTEAGAVFALPAGNAPPKSERAVVTAPRTSIAMRLVGASPAPRMEPLEELRGKVHYLRGSDPKGWQVNVPTYRKVAYRAVYPGIDVVFYGNQRQLEYDFVVAAGADPRVIRLAFDGAESVRLAESGDLILSTAAGAIAQRLPLVYQDHGTARTRVPARYVLAGRNEVTIEVGEFLAIIF
jgi:hypothetical protein